jgi:hypothetical protein
MPPLSTISGGDFPHVELAGNSVKARMAGCLYVPNDRQHVGSELRCLRLTGNTHALHGADRIPGVPNRIPRALAAARAALVRSEMASRSCSATAARMWIVSLFWTGRQIAAETGVSPATVSRVLRRLGLNKLSAGRTDPAL